VAASRRRRAITGAPLLLVLSLAACSDSPPDIAGVWQADDGSGTKTIGDDGRCSGMYYNGSEPLDIGGGMTCTLGDKADADGRYTLVVRQPPNERTYTVEFPDDDTMVLTDVDVTLTRQ
jgi:uncharacterized protein (DUF2147 family)